MGDAGEAEICCVCLARGEVLETVERGGLLHRALCVRACLGIVFAVSSRAYMGHACSRLVSSALWRPESHFLCCVAAMEEEKEARGRFRLRGALASGLLSRSETVCHAR